MKRVFLLCVLFFLVPAYAEFGLQLEISDQDGKKDAMSTRMGGLFVKAGQPASPFLKAGKFQAIFSGKLKIEERSRVYFSFKGSGKVKLEIAGKLALTAEGDDFSTQESERLRLNKGEHDIVVTYESPQQGDAQLRLLWRGLNIPLEPVPPAALSHDKSNLSIQQSVLRHGRELVATLNCTKCHSPGELGDDFMPEIKRDTPSLANVGNKYNESWLAAWIQNPQALRHSATMPRLLKAASVEEALKTGDTSALDLAAYISSMKNEVIAEKEVTDELVKDGGDIFHKLGCVSCHTQPEADSDSKRTPLLNVAWKFKSTGALADFLKNPAKHYKWIRMPDFGLKDDEALKLSAYLMSTSKAQNKDYKKGDLANGQKLYSSLGCISCHDSKSQSTAKSLAELSNTEAGCLEGEHADYELEKSEKLAIQSFLKSAVQSLTKRSPAEFASRQIKEVNCTACHKYDGASSGLDMYHHETEKLKVHEGSHLNQNKPLLTWIGEKLQTAYVEELLAGKNTMRPRPWLDARMPVFKERSKLMAEGMAAIHGLSPEKEHYKSKGLVKEGKTLTGTQGGFSCVICHDAGPKKALAAFEVKGIDLQLTEERLRPAYYKRWMLDPMRVVPSTKMPKFSNEGSTALTSILEGDGGEQFMAIFEFLQQGRKLEEVK